MLAKITVAAILLWVSHAQKELTPDDFDSVIDGSKHSFVMFYAPWCGHCKNFKPEYENVANAFKSTKDVVVASFDADAHKEIASKYGVSGYPTLKFFPKGSTDPEDYNGGRSAQDVIDFINGKAGTNARVKSAPSDVTVLTTSNFDSIALDKNKDVFVEFYAPWCGHCKSLKPTYDKFGTAFANEENVVIAKVDATAESALGSKYDVKGYPTLKYFAKGTSEPEDYNGGRDLSSFVSFMNEKAGTDRNDDGTLSSKAGRIDVLDEFAKKFYGSSSDGERDGVIDEMTNACKDYENNECKWYLKIMKKISSKGSEYVVKEKVRLEGMIGNENVSGNKKDGFQIRVNTLNAFLGE